MTWHMSMTQDDQAVLALRGVRLSFGVTPILRGVDLALRPGERVALIGPNGAGKSTLFHVISGRLAPTGGQVLLNGRRIEGMAPHRIHHLGLSRSFQVSMLFGGLSVRENVRCALLWSQGLGLGLWRRLSRAQALNQRTQDLLVQVGLAGQAEQLAQHLSYADQRALELAITVASDAPVLLLDEPTAGMSQSETQQAVALIRRLSEGKTLLLVEHDMNVVFDLADRIAVLVQGEVIAFDTPAAVRANPRVQAAYLGHDFDQESSP